MIVSGEAEVSPAFASTGHHVKMRHILGSQKLQDDRRDEPQSRWFSSAPSPDRFCCSV
jgi:hypothetical protein